MGLISKEVEIVLNPNNIKYYEDLGYGIPRRKDKQNRLTIPKGTSILVDVNDLLEGSGVLVNVKCDFEGCNNQKTIRWVNYKTHIHADGKYYCYRCVKKLFTVKNAIKTKLQKGKSFEQWCIENNRQDVLDRWDYELNDYKPNEILYATNKKYYFKCPRGLHSSELKYINSFVCGQEGSIKCNRCNSFAQWGIDNLGEDFLDKYWNNEKNTVNPWEISKGTNKIKVWIECQEKYYHGSYEISISDFVNKCRCSYCANHKVHPLDSLGKTLEDKGLLHLWSDKNKKSPYEYSPNSGKKVWWKCPKSIHKDYFRNINDSNTCDFRCPECQSSNGEQQLDYILTQYNVPHDSQYTFNDLLGVGGGLLRFDVPVFWDNNKTQLRMLIEYDGEFHFNKYYEEQNFETLQYHDQLKNIYCQNNNIKLLRIPYWEYNNIESIIKKELNLSSEVVAI